MLCLFLFHIDYTICANHVLIKNNNYEVYVKDNLQALWKTGISIYISKRLWYVTITKTIRRKKDVIVSFVILKDNISEKH